MILDKDKDPTTVAIHILRDKNRLCIIFISINIYDIEIDNSDVKLIIQYDLFLYFDFMI